jgi:hypothetical protein
LVALFHDRGWTVEHVTRDYGEDLLVRIFTDGRATPFFFFVQAKAVSRADRFLIRNCSYLSIKVATDHLTLWREFSEPVFLTVWDAQSDTTFWECVQSAAAIADRRKTSTAEGRTTRVWVPRVNVLDASGIERMIVRTESRYARYGREREGAKLLMPLLREQIGLDVEYDPQYGILQIPEGRFVPEVGTGPRMYPFGRFARDVERIAQLLGSTTGEAFNWALGNGLDVLKRIESGEPVVFRGPAGEIVDVWRTPADVSNDFIRMLEECDED